MVENCGPDHLRPWPAAARMQVAKIPPESVNLAAEVFHMTTRNMLLSGAMSLGLVVCGVTIAQPARNVSGARHPNLAAAQRLTQQAFDKISAAQSANEFDMDGHAAHAKQLLDQANNELKAAAEAANKNHK
jgi:hypothetical protein